MERTLVILKPDAVQRGLIGQITARLEQRGLKLVGMRFIQIDNELAARHYAVHKGKPFYEPLVAYITSSPVVVMVWEGKKAIEVVRKTMGATILLERARQAAGLHVHVAQHAMPIRLIVHLDDGFEIGHRLLGKFTGINQRQILVVCAFTIARRPVSACQIEACRVVLFILMDARQ